MASKKDKRERRRGVRRENRHERRQQQHSGGSEWDCISIPEGLSVFKPEDKTTYHIDVIPYVVGNRNRAADPGDEYFELSYPVYRNLGIDQKMFVAVGELSGDRDPVTEHFAALRKSGAEWEAMKIYKPTERQLMLFFVHEQADKGLQLYEGAYGKLGELLDEEIGDQEEDYIENFDDPEAGATLVIRFKGQNIGTGKPWIRASKINFEQREDGFTADGNEKLAAEILEKAEKICLDDLLKIPTYEALKAALDGVPPTRAHDEEEEEEETPKSKTSTKPEPDEDPEPESEPEKPKKEKKRPTAESLGIVKGGEVEHDEFGTCTVLKISKDGFTVTIQDEDDEVHTGVDPSDLEPVDDSNAKSEPEPDPDPEPEPEKPKKGKGKDKEKKADKGSEDKDDWDEDWD